MITRQLLLAYIILGIAFCVTAPAVGALWRIAVHLFCLGADFADLVWFH